MKRAIITVVIPPDPDTHPGQTRQERLAYRKHAYDTAKQPVMEYLDTLKVKDSTMEIKEFGGVGSIVISASDAIIDEILKSKFQAFEDQLVHLIQPVKS